LVPSTADAYLVRARRFLAGSTHADHLDALTAGDITRAILAESTSRSVGATQYFVAALRAFLRFCRLEGLVAADLADAALGVTGKRRSLLPHGMAAADVQALLRSCDRRTGVGRRDYALILVLLRLGLRASEVGALRLDDLDWRAAELVVHGKGRHESRLPLPADVGEAIAAYLHRGRPKTTKREVFRSAIAPTGPLGRTGVASIVRRACRRAGMLPVGPHRLRHTMACEMVSRGVPLTEISQVLRHRNLGSTAVYARVDLDQLRRLAHPWPSGTVR
jgi:site-specific recombinase XerD